MARENSVRFKRFQAAFDEVARARLCKSSGSEHSAEEDGSADLSELVDSFLERDSGVEKEYCCDQDGNGKRARSRRDESEMYGEETETTRMLLSLIGGEAEGEEGSDQRRMICAQVESAIRSLEGGSPESFQRGVMSWLRQNGFDAGLCKSRWEQTAKSPAGVHDYIDVIISGSRYIIEVSPTTHFTIARPTDTYAALLEFFPRILVCKEDKLTKVVRLMCAAMRQSLKKREMHVPPWRRLAYMKAKWFGPYKRTTNPSPAAKVGAFAGETLVGFETLQATGVFCRGEVGRKVGFGFGFGFHVGNLDAALNGIP